MSFTSIDKLENDSLISNILDQINKPNENITSNNEINKKTIPIEKNENENENENVVEKSKEETTQKSPNVLQLVLDMIKDPIIVGLLVAILSSPILQEKMTTLIPVFSPYPSIKNTVIRFILGFVLYIGIKQLF